MQYFMVTDRTIPTVVFFKIGKEQSDFIFKAFACSMFMVPIIPGVMVLVSA